MNPEGNITPSMLHSLKKSGEIKVVNTIADKALLVEATKEVISEIKYIYPHLLIEKERNHPKPGGLRKSVD